MDKFIRSRNVSSGDLFVYYGGYDSVSTIKQEINKLISRPRFRFHTLNSDESVRAILPSEDIILGGSYNENYQSGQRRNISISLYNESGKYTPSINTFWAGAKFSFEMGLELENGGVIWFPRGVYSLINIAPNHEPGSKTVSLELGDKFAILEGAEGTIENSYVIPPGVDIEDVVKDILTFEKGNGDMLDSKSPIFDPSFKGKKTQATIVKDAGSTFGSIILELATMLSAEVFYDIEGHLNFVPISEVSNDGDKPILFDFYDHKGDFGSSSLSFDLNSIVNRVVVIGANINGGICDATAVNDDPTSPLCYQRIGYRTASPINDTNITSDVLAQERASYELRQKLVLKSSFSIPVRFNPLLLVNNLISVTDEFYGFKQERFLIQSISCPIDYSGTMNVTSTNIRNIPFVVR